MPLTISRQAIQRRHYCKHRDRLLVTKRFYYWKNRERVLAAAKLRYQRRKCLQVTTRLAS